MEVKLTLTMSFFIAHLWLSSQIAE